MKKFYLLPCLFMLCTVLWLTSCAEQNEAVPSSTMSTSSSENFLQNTQVAPILFQFALHDAETDELRGFIVDDQGEVRTYQLEEASFEYLQYGVNLIRPQGLDKILLNSEATGQYADIEQLGKYYKKVLNRGSYLVSGEEMDAENSLTSTFYTYGFEYNGAHDCGDSAEPYSGNYMQITLLSEGPHLITSSASFSTEIVEWLRSFDAYESMN